MNHAKKLNSILRRHFGFIITALEEYIFRIGRSCEAQYGIYFVQTSRHYKAVMSSQNQI